ncbi:MAG: hypothetical protein U0670_06820 [Anaerolineae bacterium]
MKTLAWLFGLPHEGLHLLALVLIGRRAVKFTRTHVIIPDDLSRGDYLFVAGFPGACFLILFAVGVIGLLNAPDAGAAAFGIGAILLGGLGTASALGDFDLIIRRLQSGDR